MEHIGIYRVEPIDDICEGDVLWYDEPAFRHNRYRNAHRDGENRNTAVVRGTSKDGKKVVLEILDSVGTNPKARGAKSYKKPSDLLKSSTRRTMKPEHGKVLFSKTCSGPAYNMAAYFRRKQALETAEYIRKLRMDADPMMMALDKDTAREKRVSDNDSAPPIQCSEPTRL